MNVDYLHFSVDELLAEEAVQDYLLGPQTDEVWAAARRDHPGFDTRLSEALTVLSSLTDLRDAPATAQESRQTADIWSKLTTALDAQDASASSQTLPLSMPAASPSSSPNPGARIVPLGEAPRRRLNARIYVWAAAIAASLLLLFFLQPDEDNFRTAPGITQLVYLPDSTQVWLAPASELTVADYGDRRAVHLQGEAYFEVVRGSEFTVQTPQGKVTVLGTSFRVLSADDALHVRCQTGRVAVVRADDYVELRPGQSVRSEGSGLGEARQESVDTEPSPDAATIVARDATVAELTARLGRYYGRTATTAPGLADRRLTIELPTQDLAEAARRLSFVLQVPIDTSGGRLDVGSR